MLNSPCFVSYREWHGQSYQLGYPRSHNQEWIISLKICREEEMGDRRIWSRREMFNNLGAQNGLSESSRAIDLKYFCRFVR